jgi:hypothetical protein
LSETTNQGQEQPTLSEVLAALQDEAPEYDGPLQSLSIEAGGYGEYACRVQLSGQDDWEGVGLRLR